MWPFDIKRKKREAEERQREEERRRTQRYTGKSPAFSAPYGGQPSRAADDSSSLLNPTNMLSPLNPVSPLYHGNMSTDTGHSSSADVRCTGADYAAYVSASDSGCSPSSSSSDSGGGDSGGGGGGGD